MITTFPSLEPHFCQALQHQALLSAWAHPHHLPPVAQPCLLHLTAWVALVFLYLQLSTTLETTTEQLRRYYSTPNNPGK